MTQTVDLVGADGTVWHLTDPASPVTVAPGLGGLHLPQATHHWTQTPGRSGRRWRGATMAGRSFVLPLLVGDREPPFRRDRDWEELDGRLWEGLRHDALATLIVNGRRKLDFRLDEDQDHDFDRDPSGLGQAVYPINVVCDSPAWYGDPVTAVYTWQPNEDLDYYGGALGLGPPFIIAEPDLFSVASIRNEGDIPAPPLYRLTGPAGIVRIGVGDDIITPPFSLKDGDVVLMDAATESITDGQGVNLWPRMGYVPVEFAPIPPGDVVPVAVGLEDAQWGASVSVTIVPQFRRAWGVRGGTVVRPPDDGGGGGTIGGGFGHSPFGHGPFGH